MGELFGKERVREISLLRAGSPRIDLARPTAPPASQGLDAAVLSSRTRRVRSQYLIPTTTEASIISTVIRPVDPPRKRKLARLPLAVGAALLAIVATTTLLWFSCQTTPNGPPARSSSVKR
jgi:hypothetical protein